MSSVIVYSSLDCMVLSWVPWVTVGAKRLLFLSFDIRSLLIRARYLNYVVLVLLAAILCQRWRTRNWAVLSVWSHVIEYISRKLHFFLQILCRALTLFYVISFIASSGNFEIINVYLKHDQLYIGNERIRRWDNNDKVNPTSESRCWKKLFSLLMWW